MLLLNSRFEIVPIGTVHRQLGALPNGATVTVTSSPRFGIARTLEYVELLRDGGHNVVPHLAARQVASSEHLSEVVGRFAELDVRDLFVIAGDDARPAGRFECSYDLLSELGRLGVPFERVGIACYPEGHPLVDDEALVKELLRKQTHAHYLVSQICFDAGTTLDWVRRMRAAGVVLPLYLGVPGVVHRARLLELSLRLGVGTSLRFLSKQRDLGGRLLRRSLFHPDELFDGIGNALSDPELGIVGYHFFTFNEVALTVRWVERHHADDAPSESAL